MFVIKVIPLTYLPLTEPQQLSYFTTENLPTGAVVQIPLKKRITSGIVTTSVPLSLKKAEIKKTSFQLKPVKKIISSQPIISPFHFSLANFLSHYYFVSLSLALKTILPANLPSLIKYLHLPADSNLNNKLKQNKVRIQGVFSWKATETAINKSLKKKKQVLFLVPTFFHQQYYTEILKRKYPSYLEELHHNSSSLKIAHLWNQLYTNKPLIIIGLRSALFLPWSNLSQIIILDPANPAYKSWQQRPYYEATILAQKVASLHYAIITYYQNY